MHKRKLGDFIYKYTTMKIKSLICDGYQFHHWCQQNEQPPLTSMHCTQKRPWHGFGNIQALAWEFLYDFFLNQVNDMGY